MAYATQNNTCCSIIEIGGFNAVETKTSILKEIRDFIEDEYEYDSFEIPCNYMAVVHNTSQPLVHKAFKDLHFRGKVIKSRHGEKPVLTLYTRFSHPPEIKAYIKQLKANHD